MLFFQILTHKCVHVTKQNNYYHTFKKLISYKMLFIAKNSLKSYHKV